MADEELSKEVLEEKDMEKFPIMGEDPKDKYPNMEKFPIVDKDPEDKKLEHMPKKKKHRLRNWVLGISLLAAATFAGDYYLQDAKTRVNVKSDFVTRAENKAWYGILQAGTNYELGRGWVGYGGQLKNDVDELYTYGKEKVSEAVKLEERVTKLKEVTYYDKHKILYQIGSVAVAAGLAAGLIGYAIGRRIMKKE